MMGNIFRLAVDVWAWLGDATAHSDFGLSYVRKYANSEHLAGTPKGAARQGMRLALTGLEDLFLRPYWTRLWVIQEAVVNTDLRVWCGAYMILWTTLVKTMHEFRTQTRTEALLFSSADANLSPQNARTVVSWAYLDTMRKARNQYTLQTQLPAHERTVAKLPRQTILELVLRFGRQECQDPRDKIYAVRSLAVDGGRLKVDYSATITDVTVQVLSGNLLTRSDRTSQLLASMLVGTVGLSVADIEDGVEDGPSDDIRLSTSRRPDMGEDRGLKSFKNAIGDLPRKRYSAAGSKLDQIVQTCGMLHAAFDRAKATRAEIFDLCDHYGSNPLSQAIEISMLMSKSRLEMLISKSKLAVAEDFEVICFTQRFVVQMGEYSEIVGHYSRSTVYKMPLMPSASTFLIDEYRRQDSGEFSADALLQYCDAGSSTSIVVSSYGYIQYLCRHSQLLR